MNLCPLLRRTTVTILFKFFCFSILFYYPNPRLCIGKMDAMGVINAPSKEMDAMNLCCLITITAFSCVFVDKAIGRSKTAAGRHYVVRHCSINTKHALSQRSPFVHVATFDHIFIFAFLFSPFLSPPALAHIPATRHSPQCHYPLSPSSTTSTPSSSPSHFHSFLPPPL